MFSSTKFQAFLKSVYLFLALCLLATAYNASAELTIFDVRRTLPMSDSEKVFRDFYINGGSEAGIAVGMTITVQRRLPLYDTYQNRSAGDLDLKVGRIKIIHVQKGLAVARLANEFDYSSAPLLEDNFIMVGDRVNLATAVNEGSKKADSGSSSDSTPEQASNSRQESKLAGQIVVNSVTLSSEAPSKPAAALILPEEIEAPTLQ